MRRIFLIVAGILVIAAVGGVLSLGIFPPTPVITDGHKDLPAGQLASAVPSPQPVAPALAPVAAAPAPAHPADAAH